MQAGTRPAPAEPPAICDSLVEHIADDAGEQCLLIGEMKVDGAFGDAGAAGDVADPGAAAALVDEQPRAQRGLRFGVSGPSSAGLAHGSAWAGSPPPGDPL